MNEKLLSCPFCGGEADVNTIRERKGYTARIYCGDCEGSMDTITWDTEQWAVLDVIAAWNSRTSDAVHGEWTTTPTHFHDGEPYCSICGQEALAEYGRYTYVLSDYCPECGVKMDKEDKEDKEETKWSLYT